MPRPEEGSRQQIDATVLAFLSGKKDANWTEVSLLTLHPREEIRIVVGENADLYRALNEARFRKLRSRLQAQQAAYK